MLNCINLQEEKRGGFSPAAFCRVPSMFDSLEVKVLFTSWWRRSDSEAQGHRREAGSERSVEQRREPMNKNRMKRPVFSRLFST